MSSVKNVSYYFHYSIEHYPESYYMLSLLTNTLCSIQTNGLPAGFRCVIFIKSCCGVLSKFKNFKLSTHFFHTRSTPIILLYCIHHAKTNPFCFTVLRLFYKRFRFIYLPLHLTEVDPAVLKRKLRCPRPPPPQCIVKRIFLTRRWVLPDYHPQIFFEIKYTYNILHNCYNYIVVTTSNG